MSTLKILIAVTGIILGAPVEANTGNSAAMSDIHKSPCMKCHKRNGNMQGIHANVQVVSCVDCHGEQEGHPRKASNLIAFNSEETPAATQVEPCLKCHESSAIGDLEWTHNVHSNKVSCSRCHQLHPTDDPMKSITADDRAKLCRQCHQSKQD
ncbi:cytochrome c3 family protein [Shewanella sp. GXUN23E]|uniref:cytochrome c3 family protein n=1 Tax=Shewanella sp. GXUN23E TaxID=3422498 RepID=UPI003D7C6272